MRTTKGRTDRAVEPWRALLREERVRMRFTQERLASLVGISAESVRTYESGRRSPDYPGLLRLLGALEVPRGRAAAILEAAGYGHGASLFPPGRYPGYYFGADGAADLLAPLPWPAFVVDDRLEIVVANRAAEALWGVSLADELGSRSRASLSVLALAAEPRFRERLVNREELLATIISVLKGSPHGSRSIAEPDPAFTEILARYAAVDPGGVTRLLALWERVPAREASVRWHYRVVWRDPGLGELTFLALVTTASEPGALAFNDWVPADASTAAALASRAPGDTGAPAPGSRTRARSATPTA